MAKTGGFTHAFLDLLQQGDEYSIALLQAGDFGIDTLRALLSANRVVVPRGVGKPWLASEVVRLAKDGASLGPLALALAHQPRKWVAIRQRSDPGAEFVSNRSLSDLLDRPTSPATWYGPIEDPERDRRWLIRAGHAKHYIKLADDEPPRKFAARWHAIAEVSSDFVALHWNNFSAAEEPKDAGKPPQYAYWWEIKKAYEELAELGLETTAGSNLKAAVLDKILPAFWVNPDFTWEDTRIRAERSGISLNAHTAPSSSGARRRDHEIDAKGLRSLARELASAALKAIDPPPPEQVRQRMALYILLAMIREWGTKSYGFQLHRGEEPMFRGHCYFGIGTSGPDLIPHVQCYSAEFEGSHGALKFLLPYLFPDNQDT